MEKTRMVRLHADTAEELAKRGTLNDSFDSVVRKLLENEKIE